MKDNDFTVAVNYYSRDAHDFVQQEYSLQEYADMLKAGLIRVIADVEDVFYRFNDERPQEEWDQRSGEEFSHIRRKILDQANAVARLPKNMSYRGMPVGSKALSELIAQALDNEDDLK